MRLDQLTYIFYFLYLMIPEYFAIEISSSLPLLTVGRICIMILLLAHIVVNKGHIVISKLPEKIIIYFVIMIIVNMVHFFDVPTDSIKTLFSLIYEQFALLLLIIYSLNTEEKVKKALKYMVFASALLGILGIVEAISGINIFYGLNTVNRNMLRASYERLGLLRTEGPFGHPVYYGVYSVSMVVFSLFFYESEKKTRYLIIAFINILGTVFSSSRGQILVLIIILIYMFLSKNNGIKNRYIRILLGIIPLFLLLIIFVPAISNNILSIIKSTLNAVGCNFEVQNFGDNINGSYSRLSQLSGITWTFQQSKWIFGFGANAQVNGLVRYLTEWGWCIRNTFDIGYVGIFMQFGLIGSIGYAFLYGYMVITSHKLKDKYDNQNLFNAFWFYSIAFLMNLLSTVGVDSVNTIILGAMIAYQLCRNKKEYTQIGEL